MKTRPANNGPRYFDQKHNPKINPVLEAVKRFWITLPMMKKRVFCSTVITAVITAALLGRTLFFIMS